MHITFDEKRGRSAAPLRLPARRSPSRRRSLVAGALALGLLPLMSGSASAAPPVAAFASPFNPDGAGPGLVVSEQNDGTDGLYNLVVRAVDPDGGAIPSIRLLLHHPDVTAVEFVPITTYGPIEPNAQNAYILQFDLSTIREDLVDDDAVIFRVVVVDSAGEETTLDAPAVLKAAAESVQITTAGPGATFTRVRGTTSAGATSVDLSYSTTPPTGAAPTYIACGTATVSGDAPKGFAGNCHHPGVKVSSITAFAARAVAGATKQGGDVYPLTISGGDTPARYGYWMVGSDGKVYPFGDAKPYGNAATGSAVDLEPTPSGNGYWIIDDAGRVFPSGDAVGHGNVDPAKLVAGEKVTSLSATKTGNGYWIFTSKGRVLIFGDAAFLGDVSADTLNGPVLDSIPTPSGAGYYMVASDGGIFAFGDAVFYGSMGGTKLNAPVQSLVPDADGVGYWLVASDGGIFSFEADFKGALGDAKLNRPITGMVRSGTGYLMVGEDGGIFDFSGTPDGFKGSLGDYPPANPIVSVAVLEG